MISLKKLFENNPIYPEYSVESLADDPAIQSIGTTLASLKSLELRLERESELLSLEAYFADHRSLTNAKPDGPRDKLLRSRMKILRADLPPKKTTAGIGAEPAEVAAALALLTGAKALPAEDRASRRMAVEREIVVVRLAVRVQETIYAEKSDELSLRKSESIRAEHDALNLQIYRAAQDLTRLVDAERAMRASLLRGGFVIAPEIIGPLPMSGLLLLGSESQHDSQISTCRRFLEARKVLS